MFCKEARIEWWCDDSDLVLHLVSIEVLCCSVSVRLFDNKVGESDACVKFHCVFWDGG